MNPPQTGASARSFAARYAGRTVLAVGAHPDDIELGAGGTLACLVGAGARVVMAVASVPSDYATRRREAVLGAAVLGCELRFLIDEGASRRLEDVKHYQLVGLIDALVRELQPAALLAHSGGEFHRDHLTMHQACVSAQRLGAFDCFFFHPTMCRPVSVPFQPRAYVDISATMELKMQAISAHASQFGDRGLPIDLYRDIARLAGRMVGVPYAEGLDVGRLLLN